MDDWQLLNEYATRSSEEAFRTLVDRYAGMVYHTALRQARDPHIAQEASQAVFIALAQKAGRLPRQTLFYGWLFRATRFAVLNLARDEARRRRYEREATTMETPLQPNDTESIWQQISPHLDDALDRLSKTDREAVMVRFFGNKSHKQVGRALGISEDTAKKRVSRALERLRIIFAKRGVAVPAIGLVAAFSAYGAQAAPLGLTSAISAAALAKGATGAASSLSIVSSILKLMAWAKVKTAVALGAGVVLAAGGTAAIVLAAASVATPDVIASLKHRSGKTIVWDKHLEMPTDLDLKNLSLEQALDQIAVKAGAYWTIDYAVYDSDQALHQLVAVLQEGSELQAGDWTNLSCQPRHPSLTVVPYDPHGRSRSFIRIRKDRPQEQVAMMVVLSPDASAKLFPGPAGGQGTVQHGVHPPPDGPVQTIRQAMNEGTAEGVLVPERLLAQTQLASRMHARAPMQATAEAAARLAKDARAHWTTIYTLRKSPLQGAGIKLVHAGMEAMYAPTSVAADFAAGANQLQTNRFNLSPEDRAAHKRAVQELKQKAATP